MYGLHNVSIITLVIVYIYIRVDRIFLFRLTFLCHLALLILRRPMSLPFLV